MNFDIGYLYAGLMNFVSHVVQGCTGFGGTVVASPVVNTVLDPSLGVPYGAAISMPLIYAWAIIDRKNLDFKLLLKMCLILVPSAIVGNILFSNMSAVVAKVGVGGVTTLVALMGIFKVFIAEPRKRKLALAQGLDPEAELAVKDTIVKKIYRYACLIGGGIVQGAFISGGPLITVYALVATTDKSKFRATMNFVWVILNSITMFNHYNAGYWTGSFVSAVLIGLPFCLGGFFVGVKVHSKINTTTFLRVTYILLTIVGGNMFISNLTALLG